MDTRKAILIYQYSERIKSELIIASGLLEKMALLEGEALSGAEKMITAFLEALVGEIRIAQHVEKTMNFLGAERKIMEAIGRMKPLDHAAVKRCISEALSLITTSSQGAMKVLMDRNLI
jgi:hypothetical protein